MLVILGKKSCKLNSGKLDLYSREKFNMQAMQIARSIVENVARGTEVVQKNETVDILWSGK